MADLFGTYGQRIKLTVDHTKIDSDVTWFPVTVQLTSAQGEEVFTEFDDEEDFDRCAFTTSDESTQLYADCELFRIHTSKYPVAQSADYVKATSSHSSNNYLPYYATDPTKSLVGDQVGNAWICEAYTITNQRFHIDLGSAKVITKIYYENGHGTGGDTTSGVNNFTFWGSNTGAGTFDDLVYANDEGWTELTCSQNTFDEHVASDTIDPKYITVTNTTAYRYYAFKFADNHGFIYYMAVRRIELQEADSTYYKAIYHVSKTGWVLDNDVDTDLYYYYDNGAGHNTTYISKSGDTAAQSVWDSNFKAVYHMMDSITANQYILDSTSNNNDGTKKIRNEPLQATGKVGYGQDFDGINDYINRADDADFDFAGAFTLEAVFDPDNTDITGMMINKYDAGTGDGYYLCQSAYSTGIWYFVTYVGSSAGDVMSDAPPSGSFQHVTGVRAADGTMTMYVDGVLQTDTDSKAGAIDSIAPLYLGCDVGLLNLAAGIEDEVRISNTARSAAWIKATYNSLWDTLLTYGSEEVPSVSAGANVMFIFSPY